MFSTACKVFGLSLPTQPPSLQFLSATKHQAEDAQPKPVAFHNLWKPGSFSLSVELAEIQEKLIFGGCPVTEVICRAASCWKKESKSVDCWGWLDWVLDKLPPEEAVWGLG